MRRYAFYLAVALLAFGIGIFVCFYLYQLRKVVSESPERTEEEISRITISPEKIEEPARRTEYLTDKEKALFLFEPTLAQWLKGEKIKDIVEPSSEIIQKITGSRLAVFDERYLMHTAQISHTPILIDVNADGTSELAIQNECLEYNLCDFWIFKKKENDFEVILKEYLFMKKFKLLRTAQKGHFDIETIHEYSGVETTLRKDIFKFDGQKYFHRGCYEYEYRYKDKNGKFHNLRKPILTRLEDCC